MTDELRGEDSAPAALSTRVGQLWARVRAPRGGWQGFGASPFLREAGERLGGRRE